VHSHDFNQLVVAATLARRLGRPHAAFLLGELRRALRGIPASLNGTLVFEHDTHRCPGGLSIASPLGTALLGLRVGDRMPFQACDGQEAEVVVERVEHPPAVLPTASSPPWPGIGATNSKENLDRRLDHALEETFPASDPVSVVCT
jgi:hypothetical protein